MTAVPRAKSAGKLIALAEANGWAIREVDDPANQRYGLECIRGGTTLQATWCEGRTEGGRVVLDAPIYGINLQQFREYLEHEPKWEGRTLQDVTEDELRRLSAEMPDELRTKMQDEYEYLKTYVSGHPLDQVNMRAWPDVVEVAMIFEQDPVTGYWTFEEGETLKLMGLVEELKLKTTKKKNQMATFALSDMSGSVNCVAFGGGYEQMTAGMLVAVDGEISERNELREFKVKRAIEVAW
jgi:hypothetical protein